VTKKGLITLGKGSVIPLGTTLCGLKRIEKKYKTARFNSVSKPDNIIPQTELNTVQSCSLNKF
jgi:hypothetical protein